MGALGEAAVGTRFPPFEPDHALIVALDGDIGGIGVVERRCDMGDYAERTTGPVVGIRNIGRRVATGIATMHGRADNDAVERVLHRGVCDTHHHDRRKKLHQNRNHDDGSEPPQPLAHGIPYPARVPDVPTKHGNLEMSISRPRPKENPVAK